MDGTLYQTHFLNFSLRGTKGGPKLHPCTEVRFASLLSGEFATMAVINLPEMKLAKRTSVPWGVFFGPRPFIIIKNSHQELYNEWSNFILSPLEVGH